MAVTAPSPASASAPATGPAPGARTSPAGTFKVDLHSHTGHSKDSLCPAARLLDTAVRRGLSGLAVTDHDTLDGALQAMALVERDPQRYRGLTVLPGEEVKTTEGELIALFIQRTIPRKLSPEETIAAIREQGGLVLVPHPFDRVRGSRLRAAALERVAGLVDGIEVYNARTTIDGDNHQAVAFAARHDLVRTAGSDAHAAWEVGDAYVVLSAPPATTAPAFLEQLRGGRIVGRPTNPLCHAVSSLARLRKRLGLAPAVQL